MARQSGLFRGKQGNFQPKESFDENKFEKEVKTERKHKIPKKSSEYTHQASNVRVSARLDKEIDTIRQINHQRYKYEAVQLAINDYVKSLSPSQRKLFELMMEDL